jgi:hypothetical protein
VWPYQRSNAPQPLLFPSPFATSSHQHQLNVFEIDGVLDSLREALAEETVLLEEDVEYLQVQCRGGVSDCGCSVGPCIVVVCGAVQCGRVRTTSHIFVCHVQMCMEDGVEEHVEIRNVGAVPSAEPTLGELRAIEAKLQKEWLKRVGGGRIGVDLRPACACLSSSFLLRPLTHTTRDVGVCVPASTQPCTGPPCSHGRPTHPQPTPHPRHTHTHALSTFPKPKPPPPPHTHTPAPAPAPCLTQYLASPSPTLPPPPLPDFPQDAAAETARVLEGAGALGASGSVGGLGRSPGKGRQAALPSVLPLAHTAGGLPGPGRTGAASPCPSPSPSLAPPAYALPLPLPTSGSPTWPTLTPTPLDWSSAFSTPPLAAPLRSATLSVPHGSAASDTASGTSGAGAGAAAPPHGGKPGVVVVAAAGGFAAEAAELFGMDFVVEAPPQRAPPPGVGAGATVGAGVGAGSQLPPRPKSRAQRLRSEVLETRVLEPL